MANIINSDKVYKEFGVKTGENTSEFFEIGADAKNVFIQNAEHTQYGDVDGVVDLQTKLDNFNKSVRNIGSGNAANNYAAAFGYRTSAEGEASHAEGAHSVPANGVTILTQAKGAASHAEGRGTISGGEAAHSEGYLTQVGSTATLYNYNITPQGAAGAHAEGLMTIATNLAAHAEGVKTKATSPASHAEGEETAATGRGSHAEGGSTRANGFYSHAEGANTQAIGDASHAEGSDTIAYAPSSHAEGEGSHAEGYASHAEGFYTIATGYYSHAEGYNTSVTGDAAHSEGYNTSAYGHHSHAEGELTIAELTNSHAEGWGTEAGANSSHTEGYKTRTGLKEPLTDKIPSITDLAAHAEGIGTCADNQAAHAEGIFTIAEGAGSHSEGYSTIAQGDYSHAEGRDNIAGKNSHVEGGYHISSWRQEIYTMSSMAKNVIVYSNFYNPNEFKWYGEDSLSNPLIIDQQQYNTYAFGTLEIPSTPPANMEPYLALEPGYYGGFIKVQDSDEEYNIIYHKIHESHNGGPFEIYSYEMTGGDFAYSGHITELCLSSKTDEDLSIIHSFDEFSHVQGKYSKPISNCAHIVGGGTSSSNRKNIHTLDWSGNAEFAGDVTLFGCGGSNPIQLSALTKGPLIIQESMIGAYSSQGEYGDKILDAIQKNRQILILLNNQGESNYSLYSPVITYHLPQEANTELSLFYLPDGISPTNFTIKEAQFMVSNPITFNDNLKN